jgi:hypothetical protein
VENESRKTPAVYSKTIRAGRRRTYFFDVRTTRGNDYYITITESKKRFHEDGYERHKVFLYKEDFNKFLDAMNEVVNHVKTDLLPEYDFDEFNHAYEEGEHHEGGGGERHDEERTPSPEPKAEVSEGAKKSSSSETPPPPIDDDDLKM